jgi:hypothetical protein
MSNAALLLLNCFVFFPQSPSRYDPAQHPSPWSRTVCATDEAAQAHGAKVQPMQPAAACKACEKVYKNIMQCIYYIQRERVTMRRVEDGACR